jgi:acyl dehydratase
MGKTGLFFEDFVKGRSFVTAPRTVTADDIAAFAGLSADDNAIHRDATAAAAAGFRAPIAHGALGIAIATGLASQLGLTRGTLLALTGLSWRFRAPIMAGDTVTLSLLVSGIRNTSASDRGLVTLTAELTNQDGVLVQEGEFVELVRRRPAGA